MEDNRPYPDMPAVQWRERIANHLRFWMRVRDYRSAERLAHESGVNKGNVCRILRGDSAPGVRTLAALANALEISIEDLLSETQNMLETEARYRASRGAETSEGGGDR